MPNDYDEFDYLEDGFDDDPFDDDISYIEEYDDFEWPDSGQDKYLYGYEDFEDRHDYDEEF
jgi:hypothetical protein